VKPLFGWVDFREDVVMVIEKVERLRELKCVLLGEGMLFCPDCASLHQQSEVAKTRVRRAS
jgi:hypothetical protein